MWNGTLLLKKKTKYVFAAVFTQGQKAGLHLDTNGVPQLSQSVTAPPNLQPFFDDMSDSESQSNFSSLKVTPPPPPPSLLLLSSLHRVISSAQASPQVVDVINFFSLFLLFSFHHFITPSGQREEVCLPYDRHTLFTPPSPKPNTSLPTQRSKVCPLSFRLSISLVLFLHFLP